MTTKTKTPQTAAPPAARPISPLAEGILWAAAGAAAAWGQLLGGMYPLGLALAMGLSSPYALFAAGGAAAGYALALPGPESARYLGALGAVAAVRLLARGREGSRQGMWPAVLAGAGTLVLVQAMLTVSGAAPVVRMLFTASEALLCGGLAAAVWAAWALPAGVPGKELGRLAMFGAATAALAPFGLGPLRLGWCLPAAALLAEGWRGRRSRVLPAAIAAAGAIAAGDASLAFAGAFMALGALAASFLPGERLGMALVYFTCGCLGAAAAPGQQEAFAMLVSSGAASLLFGCMPRQWLAAPPAVPRMKGAEFEAAGRLSALAGALEAVGQTVQQVVDKLPAPEEGYDWVTDRTAEQVCLHCGRRDECWGAGFGQTVEGLWKLKPLLEQTGSVSVEKLPWELCRCQQPAALCESLGRSYALLQGRRASAARSRAMRGALCEQFSAVAGALAAIGRQLGAGEAEDEASAQRLTELLWGLGMSPTRVSVTADRAGRLRASAQVRRTTLGQEELEQLAIEAGRCCKTLFELPRVSTDGAFTQLDFGEKAVYDAVCAECCISSQADQPCGDHAEHFCDVQGNCHLILCDGMGTGRPAALDGALAASLTAQLLEAGFGSEQAARLVNVALELKSDEDSAAALDVASIDLYTGRLTLFKAGGAASFLVRGGKIRRLAGGSLPVGILDGVTGDCHHATLCEEDLLVLCSDGALAAGEEWMEAQLSSFWQLPVAQLTQRLAQSAAAAGAGHPDDVTVQAVRLEKARI